MSQRCPECKSEETVKNGHTHHGKQNYQCKNCSRQFCENIEKKQVTRAEKEQIKKLLLERLSLRGICRVMGVSLRWLLRFMKSLYKELPNDLNVKIKGHNKILLFRLESEVDEMWSYVGKKKNKQWIWLAIDPKAKQIVGFYVGDRSKESAQKLFNSLPQEYRENAHFYSDDYASYKGVIPEKRHTISKGRTNHIERFNCTLRQRVSRLVRKTLSFSKCLDNHIGAIKYFICDYNLKLI